MKIIKPSLAFIGVNLFFYICSAICNWNFNINEWEAESRSFLTLLSFTLSISATYAVILSNKNK